MQQTLSSIRSLHHFEPLSELALQRYSMSQEGNALFHDGDTGVLDIQFVLQLMELYSDIRQFDSRTFSQFSLSTILEYLERTHTFYEVSLLPKMEQSIRSINRLFPEHAIAHVLAAFFQNYRNELLEHIDLEESQLFPYARRLAHGGAGRDYSVAEFRAIHNHDIEDSLHRVIDLLETDFPEVTRSFAYRSFKNLLEQFRLDLNVHHLIEEQVFLPKLVHLEQDAGGYPFQ